MPSSPNYQRDYVQERLTESPRHKKDRARRNAARAAFARVYGKTPGLKDIDHKVELSKGGSNKISNLQAMDASKNRSYPRTSSGKMK